MVSPTPQPSAPPLPAADAALFLDFDGTLAELAPRPDLVAVPRELPVTLERLQAALGGAVAIVTGRGLDVARGFLPVPELVMAAEHGALLDPPDPASPPLPSPHPAWRQAVDDFAATHEGVVREQKRHGLVLHFRLAPEAEGAALALLEALAAEAPDDFRVVPAHAAVELRPRFADKGRAVHRLMQRPAFAGRKPIFIGDDVTDEDGITAAYALGGLGYRMPDDFAGQPSRLRAWLARAADALHAAPAGEAGSPESLPGGRTAAGQER
ncbi:trehalose-phosphatase [Roseomonas sp. OT10]|uniref:trehalose-phosphatase n=1 Tax=Roseomonas cutis TaxID=2897332 RepID=UPI001E4FA777|nr:trehalose-phosphatase [Roseomonas sp. OT10]UFN50264.1 trehalose-phosphatase [Roseomonas sp. OT10]